MKQDIIQKGGLYGDFAPFKMSDHDEARGDCERDGVENAKMDECIKQKVARKKGKTTNQLDDGIEYRTVYEPTADEIALEKQRKKDEERKKRQYREQQQIKADKYAKETAREEQKRIKNNNTINFDNKSFVPELDNENRITGFKVTIDSVEYIYSVKDVEESPSSRALLKKAGTNESHPAVLLTLEDKANYETGLYDIAREKMYPKNKSRSFFSYLSSQFGRRKGGKRKSTKKSKKSTKKSKKSKKKTRKSRK
jgi:hypothetical protein